MVLKRLLVTTLGALGLGALAAGPASAQEIPPPDLFDGQVACSMSVPVPPMSLGMAVMTKVMSGMAIDVDAMGVPQADDLGLADILYVINPHNSNCGGGTVTDDDGVTTPVAVSGAIAMDVGAGYTETLMKFMAANMADMDVEEAQDALDDLAATASAVQRAAAQTVLDNAVAAQSKAHAALYAAGAGPINMAGIAEWRAKGAVEMAIAGWNTAVTMADAAMATVVAMDYNAKYVQVDSDQLLALVPQGTDVEAENVSLALLRTYANATGLNTSVQDPMDGTVDGDSAFDAAGNLILPMDEWDHDDDVDTDEVLRVTTVATATFMTVDDRLKAVGNMVDALQDLADDNQNALLQPAINEALRRATVEQAHYQTQFNTMVADNTDLREDNQKEPFNADGTTANPDFVERFSLKSRYDSYQAAATTRDNAGVTLETAVTAREAATTAVRTAFTNPQSFYQQLVDRRSYVKGQKEADVTRLAGLTGDDAATEAQTMAAATAVTTAETALTDAMDAQAAFQDLVAEGSPVKDLVETLLAPNDGDDAGDDGGELVNAIAGAYEASTDATTTANNAEVAATAAGNAVAALTAVDDPETADVDETGAVTANSNAIAALVGDDGAVGVNTAAIGENADNITELDGRVATNEGDIEALDGRVGANETGIAANTTAITAEATAREAADTALGGRIDTNVEMIGTNVTNIAANATAIMAEQTARTEADMMLGGRIDTNADDIMMNAGNIMANEMAIGANAGMISSNADGIAANMNSIGANVASIADNRNMIGELSDDLSVVRAGVAASMALAGMPAINGRGISIGVGSFDGESAFAVGFQIQGEMASFKVGVTSGGGATGASAGVGFQF